jgi:hypothetical protein
MVARLARLARLASTLTATIFAKPSVYDVRRYSSHDSTTPGRVAFVAINHQTTAASAQNQNPSHLSRRTNASRSITITLPPLSVTTVDAH